MIMLLPSFHAALPMHPMARKLSLRSNGAHEGLHIRSCRFHSFENQLEDYWRFFECNLFSPALSLSSVFYPSVFLDGAFCFLARVHSHPGVAVHKEIIQISLETRLFCSFYRRRQCLWCGGSKGFRYFHCGVQW
ncbi:hypothetical protein CDAR_282461 [Caerostris darwini]|uniref:Uncharacterized protein n=1 Tax=Caerostris darwini TaxID=1538125 RepID=A0AAV4MN26_9ARAC|nr:hypothetical protein CDAR_282461 [Caerostris darwini]